MEEDDLYQQQSEVSPSKRYLEHDVFSLLAFLGKSSNQEWKASRALFLFPEEFQQSKVITHRLENFIITCNQRFTTKGWTETTIMLCKLNKSL